ncbi:hypothetical protein [Streptomyces sp. NPDC058254]|uniref:hypothetical protein n=1 Tax=Streptomyces sp. NPDC058254 TaxID=3346406 RepID=UPI0036ED28F2
MRRPLRYLLLATQTGLAALSATAVYGAPAAVYADAVIGLCWLIAGALLLRGRRPPDPPGDDTPGPRHHHAVRYSTDGEPLARSHWNTRHRH